jgi:hypothetical protein
MIYSLAMKTVAFLILAIAAVPALARPIFECERPDITYVSISPDNDGAN